MSDPASASVPGPAAKSAADPGFDPAQHRPLETRWFEDLEVGETFYIPSRTMTDALFAAFQLASGDNHPIHYDVEYCRRHGHPGLLAHGYQVAIQTAPGAGWFPYVLGDSMIAFLEQSSRFLKPVYSGDTLYPLLEITDLEPKRTTGVVTLRATVHNQDRVLVLEGEQKFLIARRDGGGGKGGKKEKDKKEKKASTKAKPGARNGE